MEFNLKVSNTCGQETCTDIRNNAFIFMLMRQLNKEDLTTKIPYLLRVLFGSSALFNALDPKESRTRPEADSTKTPHQ